MIVLNIAILLGFIILWSVTKNYDKDTVNRLDNKLYRLKNLYPLGFFLMDKLKLNKRNAAENLEEPLKALHVGESPDHLKRMYLCGKVVIVAVILFSSNFFSLINNLQVTFNRQLLEGKYLQRPGYQEGSKTVDLKVNVSEQGSTVLEEDMHLDVSEKQYDSIGIQKQFQSAKEYIDKQILKNNESPDKVISDLNFTSYIPDIDMSVRWSSGNSKVIDFDGKVHNEEITEGVLVPVTATITYNKDIQEYTRYFKVLPRVYTKSELARKNLEEAIDAAKEESTTMDRLVLPDSIQQQRVSWAEKQDKSGGMFLLFGIVAAFLLYKLMDHDLYDKVDIRNREMLLDYPEIINKFTLLVGAGMSLSNAWSKLAKDYKEKGGKKRYAYEEMIITYGELMLGTSETTAYERFGRRSKLIPYLRFSSLLAQNVKKGSSGLLHQLELEAAEAFEERKELAKRMGEEAGTKLLFPMMLMLMLVLAVILVPAFISLRI